MKGNRRSPQDEIDWQQVNARLALAAAATREVFEPSPERAELVLRQRARRLAQPLPALRPDSDRIDVLAFNLLDERYAIETRCVQELVRVTGLTEVPGVPDVVAGIVNLRGQVLVVFNVRPLFGLASRAATQASRILVCGHDSPDLGILVDDVHAVLRLSVRDIETNADWSSDHVNALVRGVAREAMIVIDGPALLADQRLFVDQPRRQ